jgi:uncharacterized protein (DUF433 family)
MKDATHVLNWWTPKQMVQTLSSSNILELRRRSMEIFPGISMDPGIRFGKPCLVGTRIDVATILGDLASGESVEQLESEYQLSREQIRVALRYAAHVAEHLPPAVRRPDENPPR